ncbi:DUF4236 domain-containing protein [Bradyrhizobium sp. 187]|uniref:DUF4236 domain-containing protein n=1 Tax=Bradyrhizobium sp. 187 TaxID=2782655 RepID=UPI001FFFC5B3|nr:DUF4236 domain-containing protein [Bradyrhizobium sp. 187]UPJ76832.1 DUF4236 domain-containing protein [Bradyrhizobium sp. 187]
MSFRFRRSFKIVPGVRLNLSGSGASVTLGARGPHYTIGPRGTRTTIGLPGSGVSWSAYQPYAAAGASPPPLPVEPHPPVSWPIKVSQGTVIYSAPIDELVSPSPHGFEIERAEVARSRRCGCRPPNHPARYGSR